MENRGFSSDLFSAMEEGGAPATAATPRQAAETASDSRIPFDDKLIGKLKTDHAELLRLFGEIRAFAECGYLAVLPELLTLFRLTLETHLMLENVRFYAYLQQNFAKDADLMTFLSDVKKEMDSVAHEVMGFTNTYASQCLEPGGAVAFRRELDDIGDVLISRVELEETRLYSLYMPSY